MIYYPEFGRIVEEALMRQDRSPAWLAKRLGVDRSTVSRWLNHGTRPRDPETVARIADVLGLTSQCQTLLFAAGYGCSPGSPWQLGRSAHFTTENLPIPPTPFVGRKAQLARIGERLAAPECRLLSVVGPGGIGKSRLAVESARSQLDRYADGVCYIDLTPVESATLLAPTMLRALGAPDYGASGPERQLCDLLLGKEMLMLLDNFEHLLPETHLLRTLLQSAPGLKFLVTSRERLNLLEEWLEPVAGLDLPPTGETGSQSSPDGQAPDLHTYDATRLFLACMQHVQPAQALSDRDTSAIAAICRQLEGAPLAIELAAAWTRSLSPAEIRDEVAHSLEFLASSLQDMPARHRSMRAVFDHSWTLLPERERSLLRQVSVFRGGFTRQAVQAVTHANLSDLAVLVDKSWLRRQTAGRYTMHELARQFCEQKLDEEHHAASGEAPSAVRRRHCDFIGAAMRTSLQKINFETAAYDEIISELGNLQAAWRFAVETLYSEAGQKLALAIWFVGDVLGWFAFAIQTLEMGAAVLEAHVQENGQDADIVRRAAEVLVWIRLGQNDQNNDLGDLEAASENLEKMALAMGKLEPDSAMLFWQGQLYSRYGERAHNEGQFRQSYYFALKAHELFQDDRFADQLYGTANGITFWQAHGEYMLALAAMHVGDYAESELRFQRSLVLSDHIGEGRWKGYHLARKAQLALILGDMEKAQQLSKESLNLVQAFNDRVGRARTSIVAGSVAVAAGGEAEARGYLQESLETARRCDSLLYQMLSLNALGSLALRTGDVTDARARFEESIGVFKSRRTMHCRGVPGALLGLGRTALAEGRAVEGEKIFHSALAIGECAAWETMEAISGMAEVRAQADDTGRAVALFNLVVQHPHTDHATRTRATHRLKELERNAEPTRFAAWLAAGSAISLEEAVASLVSSDDSAPMPHG